MSEQFSCHSPFCEAGKKNTTGQKTVIAPKLSTPNACTSSTRFANASSASTLLRLKSVIHSPTRIAIALFELRPSYSCVCNAAAPSPPAFLRFRPRIRDWLLFLLLAASFSTPPSSSLSSASSPSSCFAAATAASSSSFSASKTFSTLGLAAFRPRRVVRPCAPSVVAASSTASSFGGDC